MNTWNHLHRTLLAKNQRNTFLEPSEHRVFWTWRVLNRQREGNYRKIRSLTELENYLSVRTQTIFPLSANQHQYIYKNFLIALCLLKLGRLMSHSLPSIRRTPISRWRTQVQVATFPTRAFLALGLVSPSN